MATGEPMSALVRKAQEGDRRAFDEIVGRYRSRLETQVRARLGERLRSVVEVDDVLQDVFTIAYSSISRLQWRDEESFYRWLGGIAEHLIWNLSQKKGLGQLRLDREVPASGISPSRGLRREERFERLEKALEDLTPEQRRAVVLARIDGLKVQEIAARMDRSTEAVKKLLARAVLRLRRSFGDTESFHLPDRELGRGAKGDGEQAS
jgi:RNA polymerase sigma-70 factor (ECF subfamily)